MYEPMTPNNGEKFKFTSTVHDGGGGSSPPIKYDKENSPWASPSKSSLSVPSGKEGIRGYVVVSQ